jgi:hypothetical protein
MYQEAIEQAGREMNIFEFAKFSLTCPGTEFGILQPNPECERVDAALAAMCQPEDDFPVLPRPDRIDDFNAITFIEEDLLEKLFELYDGDRHLFDSDIYQVGSQYSSGDYSPCAVSRSYHPGRIYGSGHYGNPEQEARYQCFIRDPDMVFSVLEEYNNRENDFDNNQYSFDDLQEEPIVMRIAPRPTEIEEGEIVDDVYPHDLLDPEPFIRAPVISYEAAMIMEEQFYEAHWEEQFYKAHWEEQFYEAHWDKEYQESSTLWDIRDQERENYEEYLLEMAEQAEMEYDDW